MVALMDYKMTQVDQHFVAEENSVNVDDEVQLVNRLYSMTNDDEMI